MKTPRVLIVDDNAMNVDLVSFLLSADSMQVEFAVNAAQASAAHRRAASRRDPDGHPDSPASTGSS